MSAVFIFEIKGAKNFQLFKGPFHRNGWPYGYGFSRVFQKSMRSFEKI